MLMRFVSNSILMCCTVQHGSHQKCTTGATSNQSPHGSLCILPAHLDMIIALAPVCGPDLAAIIGLTVIVSLLAPCG